MLLVEEAAIRREEHLDESFLQAWKWRDLDRHLLYLILNRNIGLRPLHWGDLCRSVKCGWLVLF